MFAGMSNSPLAISRPFSPVDERESSQSPPCNEMNSRGLVLFQPTDDRIEGTHAPEGASSPPAHRTTLQERREKLIGGSLLSLCVETLQDDCNGTDVQENAGSTFFRGWSRNDLSNMFGSPVSSAAVKVVSYNILAQRLVSTERYPHCPLFALAEDYRCGLTEKELCEVSPDIIMLQEISVDVFEKHGSLGANLRGKHGFDGNHIVITDALGRPRHRSDDTHIDGTHGSAPDESQSLLSRTASPLPSEFGESCCQLGGVDAPGRSEMEGVATFFLKDRFELLEVVPIRFNEIAEADATLTKRERCRLQRTSHNVALITVLRDLTKPHVKYVICNLHLAWSRTECQLWQMHHILSFMEQIKEKHEVGVDKGHSPVAVVLGGDFNSDPRSPPALYALTGQPPVDSDVVTAWRLPCEVHGARSPLTRASRSEVGASRSGSPLEAAECRVEEEQCNGCIDSAVNHSLSLSDAYQSYRERHPRRVSSVNPSNNGEGKVLDHIFIDGQHLVCTDVLRLSCHTKLPTQNCPSDHCPVGAIIAPLNAATQRG
uniref:Uncharacterized protein TCIL3000_11_8300 n=1 Tax=Trypanosoma congolense (strain IL3000) TaxID=1068625 RepID=G0V161_TRYCI|nr:unnamed protein product [Trypanosoma congolense IL3000]